MTRRMQEAAACAVLTLAIAAAGTAARPHPLAPPGAHASAAPLRVQVGQLITTGFAGTTAPAWMRARLAKRELGGVILFGHNVASRAQVRSLDVAIQHAARGDALVATDQEGGQVRRLPWASPLRDGFQQPTTHIAYRSAQAAAGDLADVGVNVNLAPVADVALGA